MGVARSRRAAKMTCFATTISRWAKASFKRVVRGVGDFGEKILHFPEHRLERGRGLGRERQLKFLKLDQERAEHFHDVHHKVALRGHVLPQVGKRGQAGCRASEAEQIPRRYSRFEPSLAYWYPVGIGIRKLSGRYGGIRIKLAGPLRRQSRPSHDTA